jgi:hypothetical protein
MRIVDIRETSVALKSSLRNAVFDFSEMTTSVVAVIHRRPCVTGGLWPATRSIRTGRYACGAQMRARFVPRILEAKPESLLNAAGDNLDPRRSRGDDAAREAGRTYRALDRDRHDRSGGVGRRRQDRGQAACTGAGRALQRRQGAGAVPCYVGGGWYEPGKGIEELQDEIRSRLDEGYRTMKIKVGGAPSRKT